jgi:uncharacterized membrane protein (DUF2068 family)
LLLFAVASVLASTLRRASGFPEAELLFTDSPTVVIVANGGGSSAVAVPVLQEAIAKIVGTALSDPGLRLVALFKFIKAVALVAAGLGTLRLLDPDFALRAESWSAALATGSGRRVFAHVLGRVVGLPPGRLELLGIGALFYAVLFATEGTGLWLGRRWAEYLTLVATASFVPLEVVELARRPSAPAIATLVLNLTVVTYLWRRIRRS